MIADSVHPARKFNGLPLMFDVEVRRRMRSVKSHKDGSLQRKCRDCQGINGDLGY
jgi:hypothetical protein